MSAPSLPSLAAAPARGRLALPRALWCALLALVAQLALPAAHRAAFGVARLQDATVAAIEETAGARLGADARAIVRDQVAGQSPLVTGVVRAGLGALVLVVAAAVMHGAAMLADPSLPAKRALDAAVEGAAVAVVLRAVAWGVVLLAVGPDAGVAIDWTEVARADAGLLAPDVGPVLQSLLSGIDGFALAGAAAGAAALARPTAPATRALSPGAAAAVAATWPLLATALRGGLAALLHAPVR